MTKFRVSLGINDEFYYYFLLKKIFHINKIEPVQQRYKKQEPLLNL